MRRIVFRGFGLNLSTIILALLISSLLAGATTLIKPVVVPGQSAQVEAASTACHPSIYWKYKPIQNQHGGGFWTANVQGQIRYNGCTVMVVTGSQHCSYWGIGYSIDFRWCSWYSQADVKGQQYIYVGARFQLYVAWQGFPLSIPVHMCQMFTADGVLRRTVNGPVGPGC